MVTAVITANTTAQNATPDNQYTGVADTRLREGSPTTNYGSDVNIEVVKYGVGDHTHALLRFDGLSNIPSNAVVSSATLYIYQNAQFDNTHSIDLRRMLQAWTEAGATWNTYNGTNSWNTAGALGAATDRVAAVESTTSIGTALQYYGLDCTSLVQDIVDGTIVSDEGFHLERNGTGNDGKFKTFTASNGTDGQRPELVVVYTTPPAGPTVDDINTDEIIEDGETGVTFATTGFAGEITSTTINDGLAGHSVACSNISSTGGNGTFDAPDATAVVSNTAWCPFSTASHSIQATLGDGTDTDDLAITYNPATGYAVVEVASAVQTQGSVFEDFSAAPTDTSQVLYPTADNTSITATGIITTDSTVDIDMWFWDADDGLLKPFTANIASVGGGSSRKSFRTAFISAWKKAFQSFS